MDSATDLDSMQQMTNELDDIDNLFEFGDIDLNNIPGSVTFEDELQQQHVLPSNTSFQPLPEASVLPSNSAHDFGGHEVFSMQQSMGQQRHMDQHSKHAPTINPYVSGSIYQDSMQQSYDSTTQNFQYNPQHGFSVTHNVPPTPNSYEMHGRTGGFMQQTTQNDPHQRAILEQRYHIRKDDAIAYTPMVSPSSTPQYSIIPEFTIPGAYFSPLTSPMLHAQNQLQSHVSQQQQQSYLTSTSTAPASTTNSPVDFSGDIDMFGTDLILPGSADPQPRNSRRKAASIRNVSAGPRTNRSQVRKPPKRKSTVPSPVLSQDKILQRSIRSQTELTSLQVPSRLDSSKAGRTSPETLAESSMGPPPRPGFNHSPSLIGQQHFAAASAIGTAATPKSLLTMRGNQQAINGQQDSSSSVPRPAAANRSIDDLSLPEAATKHSQQPSLTELDSQLPYSGADLDTPHLSARKTPKLGPLSTPASSRPGTAIQSPEVLGSSMFASSPAPIAHDVEDGKGGRSAKKRGVTGAKASKLISPALVPKISPSIKPLLPEGTLLNSATQAMLLASKSNYQNILEGNHLPGVSYPGSLSTGLSSKRTSHKVAEQGRRNRINEALKEMQSLIPKSPASKAAHKEAEADGDASPEAGDEDRPPELSTKEERAEALAKSNNSKAATVELANEYIRRMQKESATQSESILQLRRETEELRKQLSGHTGQSPADSHARAEESASFTPGMVEI